MLLQNALEGAVEFKTNMSNSYVMNWTELDHRPTEIIFKLSYSASFKELSHTALQIFLLHNVCMQYYNFLDIILSFNLHDHFQVYSMCRMG